MRQYGTTQRQDGRTFVPGGLPGANGRQGTARRAPRAARPNVQCARVARPPIKRWLITRPCMKRVRAARPDVKRALAVAWAIVWYLLVHDRRGKAMRLALIVALLWMLPRPAPAAAPHSPAALATGVSALAHARPLPVAHGAASAPTRRYPNPIVAARVSDTTSSAVRRLAVASNMAGYLAAPPSTSAAAIQRALRDAGSPLADTRPRHAGITYAQYLWDRGKESGIDPAVAMALFWHESHYGTLGMATLTHDLANARPDTTGPQLCNDDGCYAYDSDWFAGIDRMYALLRRYHSWGLLTVDQLVPVWAPPGDFNDDGAYIESVHETLQRLDLASR